MKRALELNDVHDLPGIWVDDQDFSLQYHDSVLPECGIDGDELRWRCIKLEPFWDPDPYTDWNADILLMVNADGGVVNNHVAKPRSLRSRNMQARISAPTGITLSFAPGVGLPVFRAASVLLFYTAGILFASAFALSGALLRFRGAFALVGTLSGALALILCALALLFLFAAALVLSPTFMLHFLPGLCRLFLCGLATLSGCASTFSLLHIFGAASTVASLTVLTRRPALGSHSTRSAGFALGMAGSCCSTPFVALALNRLRMSK